MSKPLLILIIGLLCTGQPVFCGPFEDHCKDEQFMREVSGYRTFARTFMKNTRKAHGRTPWFGTVSPDQEGFLTVTLESVAKEHATLSRLADKSNPEHKRVLAELTSVWRKLFLISLRHTGVGRFLGDHKRLVLIAVLALGTCCLSLLPKKQPVKKPSLWAQLLHSFNL